MLTSTWSARGRSHVSYVGTLSKAMTLYLPTCVAIFKSLCLGKHRWPTRRMPCHPRRPPMALAWAMEKVVALPADGTLLPETLGGAKLKPEGQPPLTSAL